jgi:5-methylcytosine-specific restriction enzyme A
MTGKNSRVPQLRRTGRPQAPAWSRRVPTRSSQATGPSARARRLVFARAFGFCESCGISVIGRPYSIAPRVEQGTGGTSRAEANALWNLSLLCGSAASPGGCYLLCERRDQDMHDRGMWLRSWEDPGLVPLWLFNPEGPRIRAWLNDDGTYDLEAPVGATA